MLAAFILLGMLFGSDGIFKIPFEDFFFAEQICSFALIFIMFYGGFGTKWASARPVAGKAVLLSTLGVALTAYALPTPVGGNGYLSAYPAGIVLGNRHLPGKRTLIPAVSRQLNMIDENADVLTTFTDSTDEVDLQFAKLKIRNGQPWQDQYLRDLQLPPELLVVLLLRGGAHLVPDGAVCLPLRGPCAGGGRALPCTRWGFRPRPRDASHLSPPAGGTGALAACPPFMLLNAPARQNGGGLGPV